MSTPTKATSKPGVRTSEFWMTAATKAAMIGLIATGKISPELGAGLIAGNAAAYTGYRTWAKKR